MNNELLPDRHIPEQTRSKIAVQLARYYSELSGLSVTEERGADFSISRMLLSHATGTPLQGREREVCGAAATVMAQQFDPFRNWVPLQALRTLGADLGPKGGYLTGVDTVDPVDVLRPWSVVASAGAVMMNGLANDVLIPRVTSATTATWVGEPSAAPSESPTTLGNASMSPKTAIAFIKISMQLLKQGQAVEQLLRAQLLGAVGELLDASYFAGAGGVAPLGLLNHSGIGTQAGASLAHAGILAMRRQVLAAGGRQAALQWVGAPAVQETLGARERSTGGGRFLWDDNGILGAGAHATKNAPASTLVCGDFSTSNVGVWGPGIRLDIDPSQDFNSAGLVARVMLMCDVSFPRPDAFCVATSVT